MPMLGKVTIGINETRLKIPTLVDRLGFTPILKKRWMEEYTQTMMEKLHRTKKRLAEFPQQDGRGVVGGMDPTTLSNGKHDMIEESANVDGNEGTIYPIVEVVL